MGTNRHWDDKGDVVDKDETECTEGDIILVGDGSETAGDSVSSFT